MSKKYPYLTKVSKKMIDEAVRNDTFIGLTICSFRNDKHALQLRDMLWYAWDNDVMIMFQNAESFDVMRDSDIIKYNPVDLVE